jgi:hypothetical protein
VSFDAPELIRSADAESVMEDQPTVLWSLERDGHRTSCRVKLAVTGSRSI